MKLELTWTQYWADKYTALRRTRLSARKGSSKGGRSEGRSKLVVLHWNWFMVFNVHRYRAIEIEDLLEA